MDLETIDNYKGKILLLQRLAFAFVIVQALVSLFQLFVPSIIEKSLLSLYQSIILGIFGMLFIVILGSRIVDLEGGDKSSKLIRLICLAGIIQQTALGVNTIYTISFYTIAVIGESIIIPKLSIIQRTQNFVSHDKLTPEVFQTISHASKYLDVQVRWVVNTVIILIITSIISIFMVTLFNILPVIVPNVLIIQIISILAVISLVTIMVLRAFPEYDQVPEEYEVFIQ